MKPKALFVLLLCIFRENVGASDSFSSSTHNLSLIYTRGLASADVDVNALAQVSLNIVPKMVRGRAGRAAV